MNLYIYSPTGHGPQTFAVVESSVEKAFATLDAYVRSLYFQQGRFTYNAEGWGTDSYKLEVFLPGQVFEHENH